jgi:hypothetical protein
MRARIDGHAIGLTVAQASGLRVLWRQGDGQDRNPSTAARRRAGGAESTRVEAYVGRVAPATWELTGVRALVLDTRSVRSRRPGALAARGCRPACAVEMLDDRGAMLRALADEDTLRVLAQVVTATGTGLPQRSAEVARIVVELRWRSSQVDGHTVTGWRFS